jgi:sterol desaturase/sphingolipid hydroxylase (fatty acid hydroxylase superfamily)
VEIIAEIVFQVLGWILQILGELLLQIVFEAIAELFGHALKEPFRRSRPVQPWLAAMGYLIFGAAAGGLTVWLVPDLFIKAAWLRVANLLLTPIAAGFIMEAIGSWRERREKEVLRLESFAYGFCFAFAMAVVRYAFGK